MTISQYKFLLQLKVEIASYKWQLLIISGNCQFHAKIASYKWKFLVASGLCRL